MLVTPGGNAPNGSRGSPTPVAIRAVQIIKR
jgi:hypothetical protein